MMKLRFKIIDGKCVIPYGIDRLNDQEFEGAHNLTEVVIPDSVLSIGDLAFSGCRNLKTVKLSNSLKAIGKKAFSGCTNLTVIEIPASVTEIGKDAFAGCTALESIIVSPDNPAYRTVDKCRREDVMHDSVFLYIFNELLLDKGSGFEEYREACWMKSNEKLPDDEKEDYNTWLEECFGYDSYGDSACIQYAGEYLALLFDSGKMDTFLEYIKVREFVDSCKENAQVQFVYHDRDDIHSKPFVDCVIKIELGLENIEKPDWGKKRPLSDDGELPF